MEKYLAKLIFKVEVDGIHDHFDEQLRLIEADGEMQALQTAERLGISYTEEFSATDGKKVSWQFEGITSCTALGGLEDGSLVLTGTVREQDIDGYRAYVRVRWHHLAAASTVKSKAERVYDI